PGGFYFSTLGLAGGFSFGCPPRATLAALGALASSHPSSTAAASSSPDFLRLENSCTEALGANPRISPSTLRKTFWAAARESLSALVSSTCTGFPVGQN